MTDEAPPFQITPEVDAYIKKTFHGDFLRLHLAIELRRLSMGVGEFAGVTNLPDITRVHLHMAAGMLEKQKAVWEKD